MRSLIVRGICVVGVMSAATSAQTAKLTLSPIGATTINPEQTVKIEVFVDDVVAPKSLRTYQTTLEIVKATGAVGSLALADTVNEVPQNTSMYVHPPGGPDRTDWVFYGAGTSLWSGNASKLILGGVLFFGSVPVPDPKYCGTYIFKAAAGTQGSFYVRFKLLDGDVPATFLRDPNVELISFTADPPSGLTITVELPPEIPTNDDCSESLLILDAVTHFSTRHATTAGPTLPPTCGGGTIGQDIWFDYLASCSGPLVISTCGRADFNTRLAAYGNGTSTCICPTDNTFWLACNDDAAGCSGGTSEIVMPATVNECYTLRVGGLGTAEGTGDLTIICVPDECTTAMPVAIPATTVGTTRNATGNDAIGPTCGPSVVAPGVWYSVTGSGKRVTAFLTNSAYDTRLTVYGGNCGALTCVGGADNVGSGLESVSWCSTLGTQYLILVHGAAGATGTFTLQVQDDNCNDSNACTNDSCLNGVCQHVPNYDQAVYCCTPATGQLQVISDGNPCTNDVCSTSTGTVTHPAVPNGPNVACADQLRCTLDQCISGQCAHTDINTISCTSDASCPTGSTCPPGTPRRCYCDPTSPLELIADAGSLPVNGCYAAGETVYVRVMLGAGDKAIVGTQFFLQYNTASLALLNIETGRQADASSPFRFVLSQNVNTVLGTIDYAISTALGAPGTYGPATVARLTFETVAECTAFVKFRSSGPGGAPNLLSVYGGTQVIPKLIDLPLMKINDTPPVLTGCPGNMTFGPDPALFTKTVTWTAPAATDSCDGTRAVTCVPASGTAFAVGTTPVTCSAVNACGVPVSCSFNVTIQPIVLTVELQLSPAVAAPAFNRCISFDLWDCNGPPGAQHVTVSQPITFVNGMASGVDVSLPGGAWECVTARDKLHTLRSKAPALTTTDFIRYTARFADSRGLGGHWLVGGNLNDDQFVDILDFGVLSPHYLSLASASTTCGTAPPHPNINGDDRVDLLDLVFITGNWLMAREPDCCSVGGAAESAGPIAAISIEELRRRGLGDMAAADLNGDGMLDVDDVIILMEGSTGDGGDARSLRDENDGKSGRSDRQRIPGR